MHKLLVELWPLHRTLNSTDMDRALDLCREYVGDKYWKSHEYEVGSDVLTWYVPERYSVKEAWLEIDGVRVADFTENPLHVLSYSESHIIEGRLGDIRDHLWTSEKRPNAIPWEFKYYERSWGFCLRQSDLDLFDDNATVKGVIDVEFSKEPLRLGEVHIPGETDEDILFLTNICHPAQVNDSLAGLVVGLEMAKRVAAEPKGRYGFRVLVVPETIGTICWASDHLKALAKTKFAWFSEMVGHDNSFILQHSLQGDSALIDRAFLSVLPEFRSHGDERTGPFREVVASDEMITNGPGFNIPTPSLTRWPYDEYHTSDDNPDIIRHENLTEALDMFCTVRQALETNAYPQRRFLGPVMLSRHGLWVDWRQHRSTTLANEKIMLMLEGDKSVIDIAFELGVQLSSVAPFIEKLREAGLAELSDQPWSTPAPTASNP